MKKYIEFITEKKYNQTIKPLYHGSRYSFTNFKLTSIGKDKHPLSYLGHHFTFDKSIAKKFAKKPDYVIYEVELFINKTLKITESELVKRIVDMGYDYGYIDIYDKEYIFSLPYTSDSFGVDSFTTELYDNILDHIPFKKISYEYKKYLISQGYDSIEYLNEIETGNYERYDWIVFNMNQIKIIDKKFIKK